MAVFDLMQKMPHKGDDKTFTLDLGLSDADLVSRSAHNRLFLGEYDTDEIAQIFASPHYGIKDALVKQGYPHVEITTNTKDPFVHRLGITSHTLQNLHPDELPIQDRFLVDIFIRKKDHILSDFKTYQLLHRILRHQVEAHKTRTAISDPETRSIIYITAAEAMEIFTMMEHSLKGTYSLSVIEWICMQDPRRTFQPERPQLPGQKYPGLRIGKKIAGMIVDLATRHGRDGVGNIPEFFHNGVLYNSKGFKFLNPGFAGYFDTLVERFSPDLQTHGLAAVSWAFKNGHVKDSNGQMIVWHPEDQIYPITAKFKTFFRSRGYRHLYDRFRKHPCSLRIDWGDAREIWRYSLAWASRANAQEDEGEEGKGTRLAEKNA